MNIYVNGRFLTQRVTGVQRYAIELVKRWDALLEEGELDPGHHRFILLVPGGAIRDLGLRRIRVERTGPAFLKGHLWEQLVLPIRSKDGILVNLCNTGPLFKRRQVATIHDAAVYEQPASFSFAFRNAYKLLQRSLGLAARKIITVSQFSKAQLIEHIGIKGDKIRVVALGREHMEELKADYRVFDKFSLKPSLYLLAVSSMNPSKNFANVVRAMELLKGADYEIVIAGADNGKVFGRPDLPGGDRIKRVGYVSDGELKALYEGAACFVFPSYYEGFGLPPLEAMACGTPVIVSRAASLPEVCGDATLYCDPGDPGDIARAIDRVMMDEGVREKLRVLGLRRSGHFSWEICARQTFEVIKEAVTA